MGPPTDIPALGCVADADATSSDIEACYGPLLRAANNCEGFSAVEELRHALQHTRAISFAKTKRRLTPLSRQVFDEIRDLFPIDKAAFDETDRLKEEIVKKTLLLRMFTMLTYIFFLCCVGLLTWELLVSSNGPISIFGWQPSPAVQSFFVYPVTILLASLFTIGVRLLIRDHVFMDIRRETGQFSHDLDKRWDCIDSRVTECCLAAQKRGQGWALRSKLFTIIATWNAKRAEYLDRYSTVSAWKIHDFVALIEIVATSIKIVLALALFGYFATYFWKYPEIQNLAVASGLFALFSVLAFTAWWGFLWFGRVPNDKWTEVLRSDIAKTEESEKHHFLKFGDLVENLARTVLEVQRTPELKPDAG